MGWKEDLNYGLAAFGLKIPNSVPLDDWAPKLTGAPLQNSMAIVAASAAAFLAAERGHNPKVRDIYDAMVYCSTCLSVGCTDIFPRTPVGKLIGSLLMTVGPALAARGLDGRYGANVAGRADPEQAQILKTLQEIAAKLDAQPPRGSAAAGREDVAAALPAAADRTPGSDGQ